MARLQPINGLCVPARQVYTAAMLANNTGLTLTSSYSEAETIPGRVVIEDGKELRPVITNAQGTEDISLKVARAGDAGKVGLLYSIDEGSTYRGWQQPTSICGWNSVGSLWTNSSDFTQCSAVTMKWNQKVGLIYAQQNTGDVAYIYRDLTGWQTSVSVTTASSEALALICDQERRRLIAYTINSTGRLASFYSDDEGDTWDRYVAMDDINITITNEIPTISSFKLHACFVKGEVILIVEDTAGADCIQYASKDGKYFNFVGIMDNLDLVSVAETAIGAAVMYEDSGTVYLAMLGTAFSDFGAAIPTEVTSALGTPFGTALAVDDNQHLYAMAIHHPVSPNIGVSFVSKDFGLTWTSGYNFGWWNDADVAPNWNDQVTSYFQAGALYFVSPHFSNPGNEEGSLSETKLTEWTNLEYTDSPWMTWVPYDLPDDVGWTASGGGTAVINGGGASYAVITTTLNQKNYRFDGSGVSTTPGMIGCVQIVSGGSTSQSQIAMILTSCDGSDTYTVAVRLATSGLRVADTVAGAALSPVISPLNATMYEVMMWFNAKGRVSVNFRQQGDSLWTEIISDVACTSTGGGSANWSATFGHASNATSTSRWRYVITHDNLTVNTGTAMNGQIINEHPYPLRDVTNADLEVAYLSVRDGSGIYKEVYEIETDHVYPIENVFPGLSPSPQNQWRSADLSEQIIAFNLDQRTTIGQNRFLYIANANFAQAYLEYYNGANWITDGTWDARTGFGSTQTYDLTGDTLTPAASTPRSTRWIKPGELVGGFVKLDNTHSRRIIANTGGFWSDQATQNCVITIEIDGTEPSSGTMFVAWPTALLINYETSSAQIRQYWRVRIPANQNCPDTYYKAGIITFGEVIPFGQPWAWGKAEDITAPMDTVKNAAGVEIRRKTGEPARRWTVGWQDGTLHYQLYDTSTDAHTNLDWVGISGGLRLHASQSTIYQLKDIMERTQGNTMPVIACSRIADGTASTASFTVTDRELMLYGHLSPSIGSQITAGVEGTNPFIKIETISINEIP